MDKYKTSLLHCFVGIMYVISVNEYIFVVVHLFHMFFISRDSVLTPNI